MLEKLQQGLQRYEEGLNNGASVPALHKEWRLVIDGVVKDLFGSAGVASQAAVFALGGYGRGEMSPFSDIDLMFLYDGGLEEVRRGVDAVLYPLWDSKLEAGGATRRLIDCRSMFKGEIRAQTAMLDARFIAGDLNLAEAFFKLIHNQMKKGGWRKGFARAKYYEQAARYRKFGGSVYLLEPNIKESEGGLREYMTARWIDRLLNGSAGEAPEDILSAVDFLSNLRAHLHFISAKRDDRLTFENQRLVSDRMNISPQELMQRYYKATAGIHNWSKAIIGTAAPLHRRLYVKWRNSRLKRIIGGEPSWPRLAANRDILHQALLMLHETGDLKRLFPPFKDIYYKAQYGAYHVYTVDIHSIFSVKKAVELEYKERGRLLASAYKKVRKKDILLLAILLHDIGKGDLSGMGHTRLGARIARGEAERLGYSREDSDIVSFLVESHLVMPKIAFSRDLADRHLIENFADSVGTQDMLRMLYVMTYADIAAIGPDVWTPWKERLLGELYKSANQYLLGSGSAYMHKAVEKMKKEAVSLHDKEASAWLDSMPERYFIAHSPEEIRYHIEMFKGFSISREVGKCPSLLIRHSSFKTHSEFFIMTRDAPGIFSKMAGMMAANNVNILEAELSTGKDGMVFDILRVSNELGTPISETLAARIMRGLEDVIAGGKDVGGMIKGRASVLKKRGADISPKVVIDNDVSVYYTVVDIYAKDRMGLLYDLSLVFFSEGCTIDIAKILTNADIAIDSFYIKSFDGQKIVSKERLDGIREALLKVL